MRTITERQDPSIRDPKPHPGRKRQRVQGRRWIPFAFLLPALILELLVHFGPMLVGLFMSLLKLTQFEIARWWSAPFTGLANYSVVLNGNSVVGAQLISSFVITVFYTAIVLALSWLFGMSAAITLQSQRWGRGILRSLFLIPYAIPAYAGIIVWRFMFQRDNGLLNHVLVDQLHLMDSNPFWLVGDNAFWAQVIVTVWRLWPFAFLMITAGIQTIPAELQEAASIDGAGPWRQISAITMPMLRPVNEVLLLVMFLWTFHEFNTPFVLFGSSVPPSADLIAVHIYDSSFATWNFGTGAAMSVLLLLFLLIVTLLYLFLVRRKK